MEQIHYLFRGKEKNKQLIERKDHGGGRDRMSAQLWMKLLKALKNVKLGVV